jgi:hypothetical protein
MNANKFLRNIKKAWRISRSIFGALTLIVLIVGWLIMGGLNLYCAINLTCDPTPLTWWSMFLSVFGLPVLVIQMYLLRKTVEEGIWKPVISLGIFKATPPPDIIMKFDELPKQVPITYKDYKEPSKIIIRNMGKAAAKSVKIQVSLLQFPIEHLMPKIYFDESKCLSNGKVLILNLDAIIHAGDFNEFILSIESGLSEEISEVVSLLPQCVDYLRTSHTKAHIYAIEVKNYPHLAASDHNELIYEAYDYSRSLNVGKYIFEVKVWADGMNPTSEKITVEVEDYPKDVKNLIREIALESERFNEFSESRSHDKRYNDMVIPTPGA